MISDVYMWFCARFSVISSINTQEVQILSLFFLEMNSQNNIHTSWDKQLKVGLIMIRQSLRLEKTSDIIEFNH